MPASSSSAAPGTSAAVKAEDQGRSHKVESLVNPGSQTYQSQRPEPGTTPRPGNTTARPSKEHLHSNSSSSTNISPMYATDHSTKPEAGVPPAYGRINGPPGPGSPYGRAQFYTGEAPDTGSAVRPPMGSFPPLQTSMSPSYRRTRQHAATISDPVVSPGGLHRSQQPPPQQAFRHYNPPPQHRLPPPGFDGRQPPLSAGSQEMRPRRLSFMGTPLSQEHRQEHRPDHYEMSFSRSTSNAQGYGPQHMSSGQPSPQGQFFPATSGPGGGPAYASRQGPPPTQGPPHMLPPHTGPHAMAPPPASAPAHQLHFNQYSGRGAPGPGYAQQPAKRSLSPQPTSRRHLPVPGRFDVGGPQRSPLPFPRIPSPSQHAVGTSQAAPVTPVKAQSSQSPARESSRRLSSVVWGPTGFERLESGMSRCRMCGKEYSKGSSTGTLKRHYRQHQVNVAAPNSGANPYARPSSPVSAHAPSRPRAYSHRTDMRSRREMSPFSPLQQHSYAMHHAQPSSAMQRTQGPPPPPLPPQNAQPPPMFVVRRSDPTDMDTSSAIAGSALLSMAAGGDARVDTDFEAVRRPMRSSDPIVYPHGAGSSRASAGAAEPGTRDISVSPSPSSSASHSRSPSPSTLTRSNYSLAESHAGGDTGHVMHMHSLAIGSGGNLNEADEDMDVEDDDDDDAMDGSQAYHTQHVPRPRRRATITGVQRVPLPPTSAIAGVPSELAREIGSLSATQLVALSSELVRRVATALPLLAQEAERKVRMGEPSSRHIRNGAGGSLSDDVENPLEVLFGHIKASLLECDPSGLLGSSGLLSSPCDLPFTIRRPTLNSSTTMTTTGLLARVSASMQRIAPLSLAELDWDNVGILLEAAKPKPDANKVFLTIDLTSTTLNEALADPEVGVIVAYHPPIFSAWKSLSMGNLKQSLVLKCAAAGVSIYSPHTSLDSCANGINDWLASLVGPGKVVPIAPAAPEKAAGQDNVGTGRLVELATPRALGDIVRELKTRLSLDHMRVARAACHQDGGLVSRVAICAGSGASVLRSAAAADLYFTGEMDHHSILAAVEQGTSCVLAEHTNTERGYLHAVLQRRLQEELDADSADEPASVVVSESDRDPITIE
ncbi:hypothetical protein GGI10_000270 [Coemansia sp. RSA 2530]|nr:hypothetical protein GGI10_000270 [Coemansia sp. RSA 2530]